MLLDDFIKENIVIPVILNENTYSCVSNKRAVANKHPGLKALDDPFFQEPDPITIFCQNNEPNPITISLRHFLYEMSHNPMMI